MIKDFDSELKNQINTLVSRPDYQTDPALKRIVEILRLASTPQKLTEQKKLIAHMTIDSVKDQDTGNIILTFLKPY